MTSLLQFLCLCFFAPSAICASIPKEKHLENINPGTRSLKSNGVDLVGMYFPLFWGLIVHSSVSLFFVLYKMFKLTKAGKESYWASEWRNLYMKAILSGAEMTGTFVIRRDLSAVQANRPTIIGPVFTFILPWVELGRQYLWKMVLLPLYLAISNAIKRVYSVLKPYLQSFLVFLSKYWVILFWCMWSLGMTFVFRDLYSLIELLISLLPQKQTENGLS